jgi:mono/diheme cytochrome c family protein
MPALGLLQDEDIADILTYVRQNFNNKAEGVSVEEIRKARQMPGGSK